MSSTPSDTTGLSIDLDDVVDRALGRVDPLAAREVGRVVSVSSGVARIVGLPGAQADEVVRFDRGRLGMVFNLDPKDLGVVLLDESTGIESGDEVTRTGQVVSVPVGDALLGRVVDGLGRPLDGRGAIDAEDMLPVERPAPGIMERAPVTEPLQTGIKVIDALIPIGRGQRELIVGDRQTGKTAIAVDTILNQHDKDVLCIYCSIGQRASAAARVIDDLKEHDALNYSVVITTTGEDAAGMQFVAPYAAMTMAEHFMAKGRDVLVILDDLTHHARAYREVSLLLRRPPGREAYPGDIFYIHSRLLERATHLRGDNGEDGGSITTLPIVETQAQNLSAYIPTNLISITDGQVYLSPDLFQKGVLPAVDVGKSVSRVGGKAQLPAYREVASDLKLVYSQFEELERFSRYGTRLDESVRKQLERGRRVREVLNQRQFVNLPVIEQIASLFATTEGYYDKIPVERLLEVDDRLRDAVRKELTDVQQHVDAGQKVSDEDREKLRNVISSVVDREANDDGDTDDTVET